MNTYTLTARKISAVEFVEVEADSEEQAIDKVDLGYVDPDYDEFEEYTDIKVTDVVYGEVAYTGNISVDFTVEGEPDSLDASELLWTILATFDGKSVTDSSGKRLVLVGFNVEYVEAG